MVAKVLCFLSPTMGDCGRLWRGRGWAWLEASQRDRQDRWGGFHGRAWRWVPRPTPKQQWEWESWGSDEDYLEGCRKRGLSPGPLVHLLE